MKKVRVLTSDLVDVMIKNRENHRKVFLEALDGWKKRVIEELEKSVADAKDGKQFRTSLHLPQPTDHTSDYDTVIAMARMSVDINIELDHLEFLQYVRDEWGWKEDFLNTSSLYGSRP